MKIDHHDLHHDFPEYSARIHSLKLSDAHFAKLFTEYDQLAHEVRRIELEGSLISDSELETLKLKRIHLKDTLYAYLVKPG